MKFFNNIFEGKKVLVTGHTGFKGSWLTLWLTQLGAKVTGYSKDVPSSPSLFEEAKLASLIDDYREDVRDLQQLTDLVCSLKPDFVFHLAAQPIVSYSYTNPTETFESNVMGTVNILEALRVSNHECTAIVITSDKCYDNVEWVWGYKETDAMGGKDIYSGSKGAAELVFKSYFHSFFNNEKSNVRLASARAGNVIGGGDWALDRIVPDCMRAWDKGNKVEIRCPDATRPWQHVLEPLSGYLHLAWRLHEDKSLHGESFNFGPDSKVNHTVLMLLKDLSKYWNFSDSSKAFEVTDHKPFHEAGLLKLNCDKALFFLKWIPVLDYEDVAEFTSTWYYKFYKESTDVSKLTAAQIQAYQEKAISKRLPWAIV
ncbi:MAG: CDP-glucose 4,6-dehydratase [Spirochaetales bacterium]|nr:CDP-glucose 4,6-dehydratase [Spirochaetales bacterium]